MKKQETTNGFKKGQGNFLDSGPLHPKRGNKITCSGALRAAENQRECSSWTPTHVGQMVGCATCVSCLPSESPVTYCKQSAKLGEQEVSGWYGIVCGPCVCLTEGEACRKVVYH